VVEFGGRAKEGDDPSADSKTSRNEGISENVVVVSLTGIILYLIEYKPYIGRILS
jgi:hypothetical protein